MLEFDESDPQSEHPSNGDSLAEKRREAQRRFDLAKMLGRFRHTQAALREHLAASKELAAILAEGGDPQIFGALTTSRRLAIQLAKSLKDEQTAKSVTAALERSVDAWLADVVGRLRDKQISAHEVAVSQLDAALAYGDVGKNQQAVEMASTALDVLDLESFADKAKLEDVMVVLFNISTKMIDEKEYEGADAALASCQRIAEVSFDRRREARRIALLNMRASDIKRHLGDNEASADLALETLRIELPLDDERFIRREGKETLRKFADATRRLIAIKRDDDVEEGYARRILLARRIAEVTADPEDWKILIQVIRWKGLWHEQRGEKEKTTAAREDAHKTATSYLQIVASRVEAADTFENRLLLAHAHETLGRILLNLERFNEAERETRASLAIFDAAAKENNEELDLRILAQVHRLFARVADKQGDSQSAVDRMKVAVAVFKDWPPEKLSKESATELGGHYVQLTWYHLLNRQPSEAFASSTKGLEIEPERKIHYVGLILANLLQDRFDAAAKMVREHRETVINSSGKPLLLTVREDIDSLKKRGVDHADFEKFKQFVEEIEQKNAADMQNKPAVDE